MQDGEAAHLGEDGDVGAAHLAHLQQPRVAQLVCAGGAQADQHRGAYRAAEPTQVELRGYPAADSGTEAERRWRCNSGHDTAAA